MDQKLRDLRTLKQHYYPEGGWGWLVITVAILVNIIAVGTQVNIAKRIFIDNNNKKHHKNINLVYISWRPEPQWLFPPMTNMINTKFHF